MKRYAISDIHGCLATFNALLKKIALQKEDKLFLLGDFIDRGPDSKGVIERIWALEKKGYQLTCLKGNHEQMLVETSQGIDKMARWHLNGGEATLNSFNANSPNEIPSDFFSWMEKLPHYAKEVDYILVHAGFGFVMPDPLHEIHSMLWARDWYHKINYHWLKKRIIIHGHTPRPRTKIDKQLKTINKHKVLDIDNGCFYAGKKGLGSLLAFDMDERKIISQQYIG